MLCFSFFQSLLRFFSATIQCLARHKIVHFLGNLPEVACSVVLVLQRIQDLHLVRQIQVVVSLESQQDQADR